MDGSVFTVVADPCGVFLCFRVERKEWSRMKSKGNTCDLMVNTHVFTCSVCNAVSCSQAEKVSFTAMSQSLKLKVN